MTISHHEILFLLLGRLSLTLQSISARFRFVSCSSACNILFWLVKTCSRSCRFRASSSARRSWLLCIWFWKWGEKKHTYKSQCNLEFSLKTKLNSEVIKQCPFSKWIMSEYKFITFVSLYWLKICVKSVAWSSGFNKFLAISLEFSVYII